MSESTTPEVTTQTISHQHSVMERGRSLVFDLIFLHVAAFVMLAAMKRAINYSYERADQHIASSIQQAHNAGVPVQLHTVESIADRYRRR
jgi:hypothetical protein